LRRLILPLLAVAVLAGVVNWLLSKHVVRFRLGPGDEIAGFPGADAFAVREPDGLWRLYDAAAREPDDGVLLPTGLLGRPAIGPDGGAVSLTEAGLLHTTPARFGGSTKCMVPADKLPADARLVGLAAGAVPVLAAPAADGASELVAVLGPAGCNGDGPYLLSLRDAQGPARLPADAVEADVLCAPGGAAIALRTPRGWEAWRWDESGAMRRALAEGCDRPGAVFTPDARHLIVPGKVDGLWQLALADGRMSLMAEGNFGLSRRVPGATAFRDAGENLRLVAPQWNLDGWLQIYQTHLFGGGRWCMSISFTHHYGVALSADGRFMAYCQAQFDEAGDAPFVEEIFVVDFEESVDTVFVGSRTGGAAHRGPLFVGTGASLVYLADGDVLRIEMLPPGSGGEDS
jgi:hypothetical protein